MQLDTVGAKRVLWALVGSMSLAMLAAPPRVASASGLHRVARAPAQASVRLEHLGLSQDPQGAQLTLQLSEVVRVRSLRLHSPERLVIDLPNTRRQAALPAASASALVRAVRSGRPNGRTLRLVLELGARSSMHLQWRRQSTGAQLLIDLAPAGAPASLSAATPSSADDAALRIVRAAHAPEPAVRDVIIAVDAGHGGVDPGATGPGGTHEKNVTLAIARALAARIDAAPGMHAVLTRDGDYFVPLRDRMERARAAHADLFVSIHADSVIDHSIEGSSVYILSERGASSEAARRLADQENAADLKGGISLAAQAPELRKREVQQAAFVVLKSPDVPSMLVETAYISNPAEERRLRDSAQQQRLAEAIFSGIADYFHDYPPQGSLFARARADRASRLAKGDS